MARARRPVAARPGALGARAHELLPATHLRAARPAAAEVADAHLPPADAQAAVSELPLDQHRAQSLRGVRLDRATVALDVPGLRLSAAAADWAGRICANHVPADARSTGRESFAHSDRRADRCAV